MQNETNIITQLILVTAFLVILLAVSMMFLIYLYKKKQLEHLNKISDIKSLYEKNILKTQLEIQEQTFQHISREIHDHINLSLTLAKLNLNTFEWSNKEIACEKVQSSIDLLSNSINALSDISKSLNAEIIIQHGLLKAIDEEIERIRKVGLFRVKYEVKGDPVYMEGQSELIIFRIIQEAFNNIIRHAQAHNASLVLDYGPDKLTLVIFDDGKGFIHNAVNGTEHAGLRNMESRINMLNGKMIVQTAPGKGTILYFTIPLEKHEQ